MRYAIVFVFLMTVLAAVPQQAASAPTALRVEGPGAPPSVAPDPKDPPASTAPSPSGNVPSKSRPATSMFNGTGLNPPAQAPAMAAAGAAQPAAASGWGPNLFYWDNGSYQNVDKSICAVNNLPSVTFYIQYYLCASKCLGGFGANPYRWSFWLYHGSTLIWSQSGVQTSTVWINYPVTLPTPLQSGTYHAELRLEKRVFIASWQTVFDTTTGTVNFPDPPNPVAQAGVPDIRLEVVANPFTDMNYQLRGWQTNGNSMLAGQWILYDSDNLGTQGTQLSVTWAPPGTQHLLPTNLNLNQWYMLKYGNYSACYSWNETRRLIYIKK